MTKKPEIDDIYPLSPMQRGMLFHSLYEPDAGVYLEQVSCALPRDLDVAAWKRAWAWVVRRHPALRTSFVWRRKEEPLQVVLRQVELPWAELDWQEADAAEQSRLEADWMYREFTAGLPVDRAPLMRFTLARIDGGWRFLWSVHHLIVDGWSVALVLEEVLAVYEALRAGSHPPAASPPLYGDYVSWLEQRDPAATEAFWRAELAGFESPTTLGVERAAARSSPTGRETGWEKAEAIVPPAASAALRDLARRWRVTLSTVVQGAWAQMLSRYGGGGDVVFGLSVFGRPPELPGSDSMVGLFINTLPVRVRARPEQGLRAWLEDLQRQGARRGEHQYASLSDIQRWSEVPRGQPLFESLLVLDSAGLPGANGGPEGHGLSDIRIEGRSNYPLNLVLLPDAALILRVLFDDRRLDPAAVARLAEHLRNLVGGMATAPDRPVGELPLLGEAEQRHLLYEWNPAPAPYPRDRGLAELFEAQAARDPEAMAVVFADERLTYGELDAHANRLARHLLKLGVGIEAPVALCLARSADMVVSMLAVAKAGGAYVPLDPDHPAERLRFMLEDSRAVVLISHRGLGDGLAGDAVARVRLDVDAEEIARSSSARLPPMAAGDRLAYLIYTSGSTGRPKGVAVEQRGVSRLVLNTNYVEIGPGDGVGQAANASFDGATFEVWGALLTGAAVIGVSKEVVLSPAELGSWIERAGIDVMFLTSALAHQIAREAPSAISHMRTLLFGGDRADPRSVRKLVEGGRPCRLVNAYGPTECTTFATWHPVEEGETGELSIPIGKAISHTDVVVLDDWLRPVPVGVVGELYIGGDGLARCYWRRPELTAERFVPDPLAGGPARPAGRRLYRTGDSVRWLPDGSIEFLGRRDGQVKVRGFRIEPGEVEKALEEHPGVREAAVVVREKGVADVSLMAFWVAQDEGLTTRELARWLRGRLPEAMVPTLWQEVASLPLTPNGKIDRQRLVDLYAGVGPEAHAGTDERARVAPRSAAELALAKIWSDVLGIEEVGVEDNFFELGGHSLLATQVVSRIIEAFQIEVPLAEVFEAPSLGDLALRVEALQTASRQALLPPIVPVPRDRDLPLSYAQDRLWFIDQMQPGGAAYNVPVGVRLRGRLRISALRFALGEVVRRHEALRTTFAATGDGPVQVIAPAADRELPVIDLAALPEPARQAEALRLATEEAGRPFDLARGPLLRAELLRLAGDEHVLLLVLHHIVADGWSMGVLVGELTALYRAALDGQPAPLPELPVQYADFAVWQRAVLGGDVLARQLELWRQRLAGAPGSLDLPTDRPRPDVQSYRGASLEFPLGPALGDGVRQLAREQGATLFMVLLAGFAALLRRLAGQEDLVLGTPVANRNRLEIEHLIGFFVNTLVLRVDTAGPPSFADLVQRVRRVALEAFTHQDLPFERLVEELRPERHLAMNPLFQVVFTVQDAPLAGLDLSGLELSPFEFRLDATKFDLELTFAEPGGGREGELLGVFLYAADLFDRTSVGRMAEQLGALLAGAVAEPGVRLDDLPLLGAAQQHQLAREWSDSAFRAGDVVDRWRTAPRSAELRRGESVLTHADLDRRSSRLAQRLAALGAGPGSRVALCAGRSPELAVAILAALKAGCAFVVLEPEHLDFALEEVSPAVLLAEAGWLDRLPPHGAEVVLLDTGAGPDVEEQDLPPANPSDLACLVYTAAAGDRPRAVMIERGHLARTLAVAQRLLHLEPDDRMPVLAPASSVSFLVELLAPLLAGGTAMLDGADRGATRILGEPEKVRRILKEAPRFAGLRTVAVSGGRVPAALLADLRERFPDAEIWALYGPAEALLSAACRVPPVLDRPLEGAALQLRRNGRLVPLGAVGEIWIGGSGVSRGYWGQEALTAERFVAEGPGPEERWFRSGDLARHLADGTLELRGFLEELPLVPPAAVPEPEPSRLQPLTAAEKGLAAIWTEVLGVERVGLEDDFFELGGHSLLATQVVSRVRAQLGVELPLRDVFQHPGLREMAQALEKCQKSPEAPPIVAVRHAGPIRLSFAQQRLWFLDRLVPDTPFYNIFSPVRLTGRIDVRALEESLREIIRRHDSLRTTFPAAGGQPRQQIAPPGPFTLPLIDLGGLPAAAAADALESLVELQKQRPFDLARGPLLRILLVREGVERHSLLICVHHIIADGWSIEVLFQELAILYNHFARGLASPLPPLPIQYADFAEWQREWFRGEPLERQLRYWKDQLAGAPAVLDLPFDHPAPRVESFRGGLVPLHVPPELGKRLRALGRRQQATLAAVVLALFKTLLHRYSGQDDILVGTGVANRTRKEIEPLIGFFVNTLVLRTGFAADPSLEDVVRGLQATSVEAFNHQDLPFEMLVDELGVERSLSRNPVCQVMFAFHNFPLAAVEVQGLVLSPFALGQVDTGTAKFDLSLFAWENGAAIDGIVEYNGDLFERATILRAVSHFERLMQVAVEDPARRVSQYTLLSSAELAQVLKEWSAAGDAAPRAQTSLKQVFEARAESDPGAMALVTDTEALTYGELNARANRVAARLRALGVGLESRVGIWIERSAEAVVALLGTIKAGGAYVPLDPAYPEARREQMIRIADVSVLITRSPLAEAGAPAAAEVLCIDEIGPAGESAEPGDPAVEVGPDNLAYVIFTSGSTGVPKATAIPHRGVLDLVLRADYARFGPGEVVLHVGSPSFDISVPEIWGALLQGACLAVFPAGVPTLDELCAAIERHRVSTLLLSTGLFHRFAEARLERLRGLSQLLTGGDRLSGAAAERACEILTGTRVVNMYGPTETTVLATSHTLDGTEGSGGPVPIGRPRAGSVVYLLGRRLEPVPPGVHGEICIGGDGLARGYLGRPDLTAERFIPDPFGAGGRLYRTGDRARFLPDGRIEFLGRIDQQVKIRGFRVEPAEVESVLAGHPGVRAAAVIVREHAHGDRRLVGYVVPEPLQESAASEDGERPVAEQVASWTDLFDQVYQKEPEPAALDFNIAGWNSSYTGMPIPDGEMREWLDDTVERVLALAPRRVLEIGCGTGLVLLRVAPSCESYIGTDISRQGLAGLARRVASRGLTHVELREGPAHDFPGVEPGSVDCVVLNSVVQYFPGIDYLAQVIERAVEVLAPGGHMFLGDVRSLPLLRALHTSVALFQSGPEKPLSELRRRVHHELEREAELAVDPAFFHALRRRLPRLGGVRIHPKRGRSSNELTKFRYQVVLRVGKPASRDERAPWIDGGEYAAGAAELRERLETERPAVVALSNLRNSRIAADVAAVRLLGSPPPGAADETVADLQPRLLAAAAGTWDPEEVRTVAEEAGYAVELGWTADPEGERFEAVLLRLPLAGEADPAAALERWTPEPSGSRRPWQELANDPLRARRRVELDRELRRYLEAKLPSFMIPSALVFLDALPLNPSGKLDRKALPAPEAPRPDAAGFVPPADALERALVEIWQNVLAVRPIGVTDSFFDLGGHSLLAVRMMAEIREHLGVELPLADLFLNPTVLETAARLRQSGRMPGGRLLEVQPDGSRQPLFLAHPGSGDPFCYLDLAQALGPEQPVFVLLAAERAEGHAGRIGQMADENLRELRRVQPRGPYLLGGWSLGGVVAYEMACRLLREGEEVAMLSLFDSSPARKSEDQPEPDDAMLLHVFAGEELPIPHEELKKLTLDQQLRHLLAVPRLARMLPSGATGEDLRPLFERFRINALGLWHYRPEPYPGSIRLFRAADTGWDAVAGDDLGWGGLSPDVRVWSVPGDHYSMLALPQVETLAGLLATELAVVQGPPGGGAPLAAARAGERAL